MRLAAKPEIRRAAFASSAHATGLYKTTDLADGGMPPRPGAYCGLSKVFGQQLPRFDPDRFGIHTVCLRIGLRFPGLRHVRQTWQCRDERRSRLQKQDARCIYPNNIASTINPLNNSTYTPAYVYLPSSRR